MKPVLKRVALAVIVVGASLLWAEPIASRSLGCGARAAKATLAQRYPLRARSKDFYSRSKISYTRGK